MSLSIRRGTVGHGGLSYVAILLACDGGGWHYFYVSTLC
jgi:hypothetical protein